MTEDNVVNKEDLVFRLRERARIRRQITTRKSVIEGKPDRISDLLEESADKIEDLEDVQEDLVFLLNQILDRCRFQQSREVPENNWGYYGDLLQSGLEEIFNE